MHIKKRLQITVEDAALYDLLTPRGGRDSMRSRRRRDSVRRDIRRRVMDRINLALEQELLYGSGILDVSGIVPKGILHA
jgi:hypothetical protein